VVKPAGSIGLPDTNFAIFLRCKQALYVRTMICVEHHVCWMAESSQLPPRARMKVHNSVTSLGSPPSTVRPLARSIVNTRYIFGFTEGADTERAGEKEFENDTQGRLIKRSGTYTALQNKSEAEFGLTNNLMVEFGLFGLYQRIQGVNTPKSRASRHCQ
jgi:hypothetical protein